MSSARPRLREPKGRTLYDWWWRQTAQSFPMAIGIRWVSEPFRLVFLSFPFLVVRRGVGREVVQKPLVSQLQSANKRGLTLYPRRQTERLPMAFSRFQELSGRLCTWCNVQHSAQTFPALTPRNCARPHRWPRPLFCSALLFALPPSPPPHYPPSQVLAECFPRA